MLGLLVEVLRGLLFEGKTGHRHTGRQMHTMVTFLFCATTGLPASDPGYVWAKPKLQWNTDGESFACSLQPGVLPVRLLSFLGQCPS